MPEQIKITLLVAAGGMIGAVSRLTLSIGIHNVWPSIFPIGTLIINAIGCLILGFFMGVAKEFELQFTLYFFAVGILGSFTTFSTFAFESVQLLEIGNTKFFILNILANVILGCLCILLGKTLFNLVYT